MFVLILIGLPVLEVVVFIEVGRLLGWLAALALLLGTSVLGTLLLRVQGRLAMARVALAVSERRTPARAAIDSALALVGCVLLMVPGFVTDALGALLVFAPTRTRARRWMSRHYEARAMRFAATASRFASRRRPASAAGAESTAVEHDLEQLGS